MKGTIALMTAALLIAGCDGGTGPHATTEAQEKESVFDPMTDQVEKAKKVEAAAMQHKDDIDKALEDADGPDKDDRQ